MPTSNTDQRQQLIYKYTVLALEKNLEPKREHAPEETSELESIKKTLNLSHDEIVEEVKKLLAS